MPVFLLLMSIMKQISIKNFVLSAAVICLYMIGQSVAQETTSRRNSPFLPNPKKRVESKSPSSKEKGTTEEKLPIAGKAVKNTNINLDEQVESAEKTAGNEKPVSSEESFETTSIAAKTLEVVKRAANETVLPTETYKIGLGDVLYISLQNSPSKENSYFTVLQDGKIDYPLAGEMVYVKGMTIEQIEDLLKEKIKLYENPQIAVKVREHNSHLYTVFGMAEKNGERAMPREALPLYVVIADVVVQPEATRVSIKREGTEIQKLDLQDSKTGEVLVFPGDFVEFSADQTEQATISQFYFIGGEIISGGKKEYIQGLTLTQAILESGGLKRTNIRKVIISRTNAEGKLESTEYDLKAIKDGKVLNPLIEAGDEIVIGK